LLGSIAVEPLCIAVGHVRRVGSDFDELAFALLPAASTLVAGGDGVLIVCAPFVAWAAEHVTRHQEQRGVVVERVAGVAPELGHRLAEGRHRFGRELELEELLLRLGASAIARPIADRRTLAKLARANGIGMGDVDFERRGARNASSAIVLGMIFFVILPCARD
jgi:hypothetical protein